MSEELTNRPVDSIDSDYSREDVEALQGEEVPDREAMSLVNANVAVPVDAAVSANVLSDHSTANSTADQHAPITQNAQG